MMQLVSGMTYWALGGGGTTEDCVGNIDGIFSSAEE
jgi:hypothetical protein